MTINLITLILSILLIPVLYWWWREHRNVKDLEEQLEQQDDIINSLDTKCKELLNQLPSDDKFPTPKDLLYEQEMHNGDYFPFSEPLNECDCGHPMRETPCYWICDNCKKRIKKEVAK